MRLRRTARGVLGPALLAAGLAACGGDTSGPGIITAPPTITITGVAEGTTYAGAVTIGIGIDKGSFSATLDGAPFYSGQSVTAAGAHVLSVTARDGSATATKEVRFTIAGPAGGVTLVRLINLGANASGGGGDAILISDSSASGMVHALIDAGPAGASASNPGYVASRLAQLGVTALEFVQLTHAHSDHYAGMNAVLGAIKPKRFIYNGQVRNLASYNTVIQLARNGRADSVIVPVGSNGSGVYALRLGADTAAALLSIIPPLPTWITLDPDSSSLENEGSLGTELRRGSFRMFFTGDGEVQANNRWRTQYATYSGNVEILKAGHHGANDAVFDNGFSGSSSWLDHTSPDAVVISANGTSHPRSNALNQILTRTSQRTYCTNVHGEIVIRITRSGSYTITPEKNAGSVCVKGSEATS